MMFGVKRKKSGSNPPHCRLKRILRAADDARSCPGTHRGLEMAEAIHEAIARERLRPAVHELGALIEEDLSGLHHDLKHGTRA